MTCDGYCNNDVGCNGDDDDADDDGDGDHSACDNDENYDDDADTPHVVDETPEEVENDNDDGNVYARDLPILRVIHLDSLHLTLYFVRCSITCRCNAQI